MKARTPSLKAEIARCLKADFGAGPQAIKRVAELTGGLPGGVAHWFKGDTTVQGLNLLKLMAVSPSVMAMVDRRTGRAKRGAEIKRRARAALPIIKALAK